MNTEMINNISKLQTLEYALSVFLFFLIVAAYFLLLSDQEKLR
ncbi:MAG TPA: hypothetical protein VMT76_02345 [Puia sp.]|nr:hypothetical protein [Puia sp.]